MGTRQSTFKVSSEEVQGPDSYVIFHHLKFGLVLEAMKKSAAKTDPVEEKEFTMALLKDAIVEWNWVDDGGVLLPTPAEGLEIESLLTNEVLWLINQVTGKAQAKNSS